MQVSEVLKNKESILAAYESNASTSKKCQVSKFSDVNERLYEWYIYYGLLKEHIPQWQL